MADVPLTVTVPDAWVATAIQLANYLADEEVPADAPHNLSGVQAKTYLQNRWKALLKAEYRRMRREQEQVIATTTFAAIADADADAFDAGGLV